MNYKTMAAGLLFALTTCSPLVAQDTLQIDFFRCAFLSRAEIAFNAAVNGELTEDMVADLTPEDRAQLIVSINNQIAQKQSDVLTDTQQTWNTVGLYAAGAVLGVGILAHAYGVLRTGVDAHSWLISSNFAWAAEVNKPENWEQKKADHLKNSVLFRWETGKSTLMLAGACATEAAAAFMGALLQNAFANHEYALVELENLQGSLEFINSIPVVA